MIPGAEVVQNRIYDIIMDIISRYQTYKAYLSKGGRLSLAGCRRNNDLLTYFSIIPTSTVPDHSLLLLDTDFSEFNLLNQEDKRHSHKSCHSVTWPTRVYSLQYKGSNIPKHFMSEGPMVKDIVNFVKDVCIAEPTQSSADQLYQRFVSMYADEMNRKLPKMQNAKRKSNRTNESFWNDELNDLFKEACKAEKL